MDRLHKHVSFWLIILGLTIVANDGRVYGQNGDNVRPWEKVVPLVTNRYEIGDAFGKLRERNEFLDIFDAPYGIVVVWYVGVKSSDGIVCDWGVPSDTVQSYSIGLKPILLSEIGYDLSKFKRTLTHLEEVVFSDLKSGLEFSAAKYSTLDEPEEAYKVTNLSVRPPEKEFKAKCKETTD